MTGRLVQGRRRASLMDSTTPDSLRYPGGFNVQPCFIERVSYVNLEDMLDHAPSEDSLPREMSTHAARNLGQKLIAAADRADELSDNWIKRSGVSR